MEKIILARKIFGIEEFAIPEKIDHTICADCNHPIFNDENHNVCSLCGKMYPILNYDKNENEIDGNPICYSPVIHFKDILKQVQGKEPISITHNQYWKRLLSKCEKLKI